MAAKLQLSRYVVDIEHFRLILRGRREELGLTQLQLAGRAGVSSATVNKLEAGRLSVHLDLFLQVVDALGLPLSALIAFDGAALPDPPDPLGAKLAALLKSGDQAAILQLLADHMKEAKGKESAAPAGLKAKSTRKQ